MKAKIIASSLVVTTVVASLAYAQSPQPLSGTSVQAALGTAFTYQGRLTSSGAPVNNACDFQFSLWDAASGGAQIGSTQTKTNVSVSAGYFTISDLDFGAGAFAGDKRWLGIAVRCPAGSGSYTTLSPRQELTATPYALYAKSAWSLTGNAGTNPSTNFLGTTDNQPLELRVNNARALRLEPNATSPNVIGGYNGNSVTAGAYGATIGGGGESGSTNRVTDHYGTVGGGRNNQAGDNAGTLDDRPYATVGGGRNNTASGWNATVGGGNSNTASGGASTVGGGMENTASSNYATVGGGYSNVADAAYATIAGGGPTDLADLTNTNNRVFDDYGTIGGGGGNRAGSDDGDPTTAQFATVGGGEQNTASGGWATVGGGWLNTASGGAATVGGGQQNTASDNYATVGGGQQNTASGNYATIAGGGPANPADPSNTNNRVFDDYGTIGGGGGNRAGSDDGNPTSAQFATVGGGRENTASGGWATVGGGYQNTASNNYVTVSGGQQNTAAGFSAVVGGGLRNAANSAYSTIGGGQENTASAASTYATIGGGYLNRAQGDTNTIAGGYNNQTSAYGSTIGGGNTNVANGYVAVVAGGEQNTASGEAATVGGGYQNTASGNYATVGGGRRNIASGLGATVPGGSGAAATLVGQMAYASGEFAAPGDAQTSLYILRNTTTDATLTDLFLDGSGARLTLPPNRTLAFHILVVARSSTGQSAGYEFRGVIENVGGATMFIGTPIKTILGEDIWSWDANVWDDNGNDALAIQVVGAPGTTIRWVALVRTVEVSW